MWDVYFYLRWFRQSYLLAHAFLVCVGKGRRAIVCDRTGWQVYSLNTVRADPILLLNVLQCIVHTEWCTVSTAAAARVEVS